MDIVSFLGATFNISAEAKTGRIRHLGVDAEVGQSTVFGFIFGLFYLVLILF